MPKSRKSPIGITLGDPAGIGPEIIAKALAKPSICKLADFLIIGDHQIYKTYQTKLPRNSRFLDLKNPQASKIEPGNATTDAAAMAQSYLLKSVELLKTKKISALVTAPVCKETIHALDGTFQGHTEFLADHFRVKKYEMMFVAENLKIVLVTRHIPLKQVSEAISAQKVYDTLVLTNTALKTLFKIKAPQIAVCGINPHAGENGLIGSEEMTALIPAIKKAREAKIRVSDPLPADTLFIPMNSRKFDAIISMYHDQGLAPVKALYFEKVVNLTIGLPFIRTSTPHGTAFDIAGKNNANPASMCAAIELAARLSS